MKSIFPTLLVAVLVMVPHLLFAWGQPHRAITKAALEVLPAWQKEVLGGELDPLAANYCLIPDNVYTDKENARFATMDRHPGEVYLKKLHLPVPEQTENLETFQCFMEKAVTALKDGRVADAARYMGTICHMVEDFGSPSHTIPGDNMFTLLQQFMPPTEKMNGKLLHGPIENGTFEVSIAGYKPQLLGVTLEEASWRLLHRVHEGIINARSTTIPIIQALYADDAATVTKWQMKAAVMDAQVLCDALHTILCLGSGKFETGDRETLQHVDISTFWPVEAVNLYYPQTHFFSSPYWGHACSGFILEEGTRPVSLKLRVQEKDGAIVKKEFVNGISTGMGKPLTWHVPKGVYQRFAVRAGLQAGLGDKGRVEFSIAGDGKALASVIVNGSDPAHVFECAISGVSQIQLSATGRGLDPKSNYAVWAVPVLVKE